MAETLSTATLAAGALDGAAAHQTGALEGRVPAAGALAGAGAAQTGSLDGATLAGGLLDGLAALAAVLEPHYDPASSWLPV